MGGVEKWWKERMQQREVSPIVAAPAKPHDSVVAPAESVGGGREGMGGPESVFDFTIRGGQLVGVPQIEDPTTSKNSLVPKGIVIHYTCSYSMKSTIEWFRDKNVSIHVMVNKDGSLVQMVKFNKVAWHAGPSSWKQYDGLNNYFIGIEVINIGELRAVGDKMLDCYDREYRGTYYTHEMLGCKYWAAFTKEQVAATAGLCKSLMKYYSIPVENVIGHYEGAPKRKLDPAFCMGMSMDEFRRSLV